ncbi:hypothetical protein Tco_0807412 [Tanacetum coccineum]
MCLLEIPQRRASDLESKNGLVVQEEVVMVCHENVVRIPLEGDEIRRVHGECTQRVVKTLMNTKFRVDLRMTPVAKYPYRLAPSEMQELSEQLQELQDEVLELQRKEKLYAKFTKSEKGRVKLRRVRAMPMTIQLSVKDKILATSSETSKVENTPAEMLRDLDQQIEKKEQMMVVLYGKANVVIDALRRKERVKPRRVRAMPMSIQYEEWNSGDDQLRFRWMIYPVVLADAVEGVRDAIGFEYWVASSSGWTKSLVLWAEIGESSLTGPELVLDTTDKVVLIKEKLKSARDRQKSYADKRRKPLEFEVGDRVLLKVSPWKGVVRF